MNRQGEQACSGKVESKKAKLSTDEYPSTIDSDIQDSKITQTVCDSKGVLPVVEFNGIESQGKNNSIHTSCSRTGPVSKECGLRESDVILGRAKMLKSSQRGNKTLTYLVALKLEDYTGAAVKKSKSLILQSIVNKIRKRRGRFVRKDPKTGKWADVGDYLAREKVAQEFRKAIQLNYGSSFIRKKSNEDVKKEQILNHELNSERDMLVASEPYLELVNMTDEDSFHVSPTYLLDKSTVNSAREDDDSFDAEINSVNFDGIPHSF